MLNYVKKNDLLSFPCTLLTRCVYELTTFFSGLSTWAGVQFSATPSETSENRKSFIYKDIDLVYIMSIIGSKIKPLKTRVYKACFSYVSGICQICQYVIRFLLFVTVGKMHVSCDDRKLRPGIGFPLISLESWGFLPVCVSSQDYEGHRRRVMNDLFKKVSK